MVWLIVTDELLEVRATEVLVIEGMDLSASGVGLSATMVVGSLIIGWGVTFVILQNRIQMLLF